MKNINNKLVDGSSVEFYNYVDGSGENPIDAHNSRKLTKTNICNSCFCMIFWNYLNIFKFSVRIKFHFTG